MKKQRINDIVRLLPTEDHQIHELNKFVRGYKLAVHKRNLKDQLKIK